MRKSKVSMATMTTIVVVVIAVLTVGGLTIGCGAPGGDDDVTVQNQALVASTPISGFVAYEPGGDYNRCVPEAFNVLNRLNARGDLMGFHYASSGYTPLDSSHWHTQGIVRLPYYYWDSLLLGQFFVADFSHPPGLGEDYDSHLGVAELNFKGGKQGKILGTNRAYNYYWTGPTADWYVTPHPDDRFTNVGGTPKFKIDEYENHAGGLSALGWHIVVPLQKYNSGTPSDSNPYVNIYDLWWPDSPVLSSHFLTDDYWAKTNMAAAITKLENGKFLLLVVKDKEWPWPGIMEFYVSHETDLDDPDLFGDDGRAPDAFSWLPYDWQNINFLTDCTGTLYMIGFIGGTEDWVDLYRINLFGGGTPPDPYYHVHVTLVDSKHMYCSGNDNNDQCDFQAAAGSYVDPNGQVIVYSTNWTGDGGATSYVYGNGNPWFLGNSAYPGYIRGMEFHERHGNLGAGTACPTLADAWVEFYEHPNFNSYGENSGQYYRVDYNERDAKNGKDLRTNYFNDKASSMRWCIPSGDVFTIYRDAWSGPYEYINGTGDVRYISNLNGWNYAYGGGSTNDSITSYRFQEDYTDPYGWYGSYDTGN